MYTGGNDTYFYTCRFIYKLIIFIVDGFHTTMGYILYITFLRCFYKTHFGMSQKGKKCKRLNGLHEKKPALAHLPFIVRRLWI